MAEARALREQLDTARAAQADLRTQLAEARGHAERTATEAARLHERVDQLTVQVEAGERDRAAAARLAEELTVERDSALRQRDAARGEADRLRLELIAAQTTMAAAQATAEDATSRLATVEARVDQLLALLASGGRTGDADSADQVDRGERAPDDGDRGRE